MAAKVVPIGHPVNDSERRAIAYLRDHLPSTFTILHNFEIVHDKEVFEIDLAILAPQCIFVVDVKGTLGRVEVFGSKWYPEGRQSFYSPLAKLREHAKTVKALICDSHPTEPELRKVHVHAAVLMTAPDAEVVDHVGRDGPDVVYLNKSLVYFKGRTYIPDRRSKNISSLLHLVQKAIEGKSRPQKGPACYRDWQIEEELGGNGRYTEYRAKHVFMGRQGGTYRLRLYKVDPYQAEEARAIEIRCISNAFRAVAQMPAHDNILAIREFFPTEDEDSFVLVTEDFAGYPLQQHITRSELALTFDQKLRIIQDTLRGLYHAHQHQVIHRNLTPDAILVGTDGRAKLARFDYARVGEDRESTIAPYIVDDLDTAYQAIECYREPSEATSLSDLFSAGLVFYQLLTSEQAFENSTQMLDLEAVFPIKPSQHRPSLPAGLDNWLQKLCAFEPEDRFLSATAALNALQDIIQAEVRPQKGTSVSDVAVEPSLPEAFDWNDLPKGYSLGDRFIVQERLGKPGGFAVAYKVFDTFGDVYRVLKLVTKDRHSVFERLRREYKTLVQLPEHENVVKVIWADRFPDLDDIPYIVFDFLEGSSVEEFIHNEALSLEDARTIAHQAGLGLAHLHKNGVYHQDIKPSNLLWTAQGVRIIDFNIAVSDAEYAAIGGTLRYIPPDFDIHADATIDEKRDRDVYALGVTLYQCLTGEYPFDQPAHKAKCLPRDPREFPGLDDLSLEWVQFVMKTLAPERAERFSTADEFVTTLDSLPAPRSGQELIHTEIAQLALPVELVSNKPNFNPFVSHLLTLYSQSRHTNAGTRGLDVIGEATYISTLLDEQLRPAVIDGEFKLVIISGNAGDGKTAFIQQLERHAKEQDGLEVQRNPNGSTFQLRGRTFVSNYDGSQDEGSKENTQVLLDFFGPYQGEDAGEWPNNETRLIAINEGRLVDFLETHEQIFPRLAKLVRRGLGNGEIEAHVAVINLNLRSVVADMEEINTSIFDHQIRRLAAEEFWQDCERCDLKDKCYICHNVQTLADPVAGSKVIERLKTLYMITHLRGRLHITLRDLRSALAFMLVGTRDCDSVHELYRGGHEALPEILSGFYFNSWQGGLHSSQDRLLSLLRNIDIGQTTNPETDRSFDFLPPKAGDFGRFAFSHRGDYDEQLFAKLFEDLPRDYLNSETEYFQQHQTYIAMLRRRHYFERRDNAWQTMLPYRKFDDFMTMIASTTDLSPMITDILAAINRGEGVTDPSRIPKRLALRVREVRHETIRSYRLFDAEAFSLSRPSIGDNLRFLEYLPQNLILRYQASLGRPAELKINLDVYEMLERLNEGYLPSIEEIEGFYQTLVVFKNVLSSAPYQEVLLTDDGHEFHQLSRETDGVLVFAYALEGEPNGD